MCVLQAKERKYFKKQSMVSSAAGLKRTMRTDLWVRNVKVIGLDKNSFSGVEGMQACLEWIEKTTESLNNSFKTV